MRGWRPASRNLTSRSLAARRKTDPCSRAIAPLPQAPLSVSTSPGQGCLELEETLVKGEQIRMVPGPAGDEGPAPDRRQGAPRRMGVPRAQAENPPPQLDEKGTSGPQEALAHPVPARDSRHAVFRSRQPRRHPRGNRRSPGGGNGTLPPGRLRSSLLPEKRRGRGPPDRVARDSRGPRGRSGTDIRKQWARLPQLPQG